MYLGLSACNRDSDRLSFLRKLCRTQVSTIRTVPKGIITTTLGEKGLTQTTGLVISLPFRIGGLPALRLHLEGFENIW